MGWCDGVGTWLRKGWYTDNESHDPGSEAALIELVKRICVTCDIDLHRIYITGCSMGAYACLDLVARYPFLFAAVVPVAAHYDDDLDELVERLSKADPVPFWFFHAVNDQCCPHETVSKLVGKLR